MFQVEMKIKKIYLGMNTKKYNGKNSRKIRPEMKGAEKAVFCLSVPYMFIF